MAKLDQISADVAAQSSVIQSAVVLLGGLKTKLDEAVTALAGGDDGAALAALSASLESNTQALAAAVAVNTPAEAGATAAGGVGLEVAPAVTDPNAPAA